MPAPIGPRAPDRRRDGGAAGGPAGARRAPAPRSGGSLQPLGDRRGLTAAGALLLALLLTGLGAVLDVVVGQRQLWLLFTIGFVLSSGLCAQRVHREDLGTSVLLPPIVYAIVAAASAASAAATSAESRSSGGLRQQVLDASTALILHTPILLGGTLLAAVVALRRGAAYRRRDRRGRRG